MGRYIRQLDIMLRAYTSKAPKLNTYPQ